MKLWPIFVCLLALGAYTLGQDHRAARPGPDAARAGLANRHSLHVDRPAAHTRTPRRRGDDHRRRSAAFSRAVRSHRIASRIEEQPIWHDFVALSLSAFEGRAVRGVELAAQLFFGERLNLNVDLGKLSSLFAEDYIYPKKVMLPWVPKIGPMSATVPGLLDQP